MVLCTNRSAGTEMLRPNSVLMGRAGRTLRGLLIEKIKSAIRKELGKTIKQTHSCKKGSSRSCEAEGRSITLMAKQRKIKFFALADSSSGMFGCFL